ncbi:hypothetical protein NA56DRAFT_637975 [Hyaloscypha hepaticicola]|uniref:Uncharacterized protein n=1 Tax=Hyaloscypha hepaticicola TaxID=2082293 RepID=A0A2J6PHB1_9HELO|nr:hypothetical protein NA56DRAFT_637975 [Hyaloscypha hepaticicola]
MATIDVSDELLRLLTAINEKLDSGRRLERRESVAANEVLAEQQNLTPNGRWGDNTLAGWFLNSDVHLRPPSSKGIFETNPIRELIEHNEEESDILRSWGLKYESPFRTHLIEARDIAEEICKIPRDLWAIPSDGRIFLALTPRSLSLGKRPRADLLESLTRLREFDADLRSRKGCGFSVLDYDPWARKYLAHGALKDDFESELFMTDFVTREICWDDQNPEPGPQSRDRGGIFAPLAMKRFLSVDIQRTAPWRRIIILCGLGTMPPTSPNSSSTGSGHRYFEQPVPNSNGVIYDLWQQEAPNLLIEEHLNCSRTSAKGSENPFLRPRGFQLVFFEILDDPKPARETIWKMGELFEDNTGGTNKLRKRLFRRSAFSVRTPSFLISCKTHCY